MLLSTEQLEQSEKRYIALQEPKSRGLIEDSTSEIVKNNILDPAENLAKRAKMLEAIHLEPLDFAYERAIGKNDSVYSNFIELIQQAKRKVGRIVIKKGNRNFGFATGFMVSENLLLTNWHVFKTIDAVADSEIQFFYEYNIFGDAQAPLVFKLQSDLFFHSNQDLDYCLVGVAPQDITGSRSLSDIGYIFLDPSLGKIGHEGQEALNIIHHPDGDYMQLSIRENLFKDITPISVWYTTDTAPGSSGSPVFNDQWQVVALHHMGIAKKNADKQYVDKDDQVIPVINGKIDATKLVWEANEGIRISVILADLSANFSDHPVVNGLRIKPRPSAAPFAFNALPTPDHYSQYATREENNPSNQVNISFPASLLDKNGIINISINQGGSFTTKPAEIISSTPPVEEDLLFQEIKRLEQSVDFAVCKGYQPNFLGPKHLIPFPNPKASIKKFIAKITGTNATLLNYHHYSVLFHSLRRMPLISGINIDGDPNKRKDESPRRDVWLRDNRIGFDIQLDDEFYRLSGFNRGHMSRREDANWGNTPEEAKRNADMTCFFTNACPQVPQINQSSRKGLWGILEKIVLENGASQEKGQTAKISVFNGPIFKDDDPVFRGVQIPLDFFKIVLWLTDAGNIKATAFKLSQQTLLGDIDFEQLDLDQNVTFKAFQCSIKSLQKQTKLDFSKLFKFDTFEGSDNNDHPLSSQRALTTHINNHRKTP